MIINLEINILELKLFVEKQNSIWGCEKEVKDGVAINSSVQFDRIAAFFVKSKKVSGVFFKKCREARGRKRKQVVGFFYLSISEVDWFLLVFV